jgi:hemerythrin-like domain-containing protein
MTEAMAHQLIDTSGMKGLHRVFRAAFSSAVALIGSVRPADTARVEMVATYYDNVLRLLTAHHDGEDELLTPLLVARCTPAEAAQVTRVAAQHEGIIGAIGQAQSAVRAWETVPGLQSAASAATALVTLNVSLRAHLDDEEESVLPIAGRYLTKVEWDRLPAHAMSHFSGDKIWLVVGLVQEQMTPEQVSEMESAMPAAFQSFWQQQGRPMFLEFVAALRG